jgi:ribosomal protein L35
MTATTETSRRITTKKRIKTSVAVKAHGNAKKRTNQIKDDNQTTSGVKTTRKTWAGWEQQEAMTEPDFPEKLCGNSSRLPQQQ